MYMYLRIITRSSTSIFSQPQLFSLLFQGQHHYHTPLTSYYQHDQVIMSLELCAAVIEMSGSGNNFPSRPAQLDELTPAIPHELLSPPANYLIGNNSGTIPTSSITRGTGYPRGRNGITREALTRAPRNNSTTKVRGRGGRGGTVWSTRGSRTRGRRGPNRRVNLPPMHHPIS